MARPRRFSKAEIMDAARAAAETGLCARLFPSGEIEFTERRSARNNEPPTPEDALEGWLDANKAGGRA